MMTPSTNNSTHNDQFSQPKGLTPLQVNVPNASNNKSKQSPKSPVARFMSRIGSANKVKFQDET